MQWWRESSSITQTSCARARGGFWPTSSFRFKVCEFHSLIGLEYKHLANFLSKKNANINIQNTENRCFGYAIAAAHVPPLVHGDNPYRVGIYSHLFQDKVLEQVNYPVEVADLPAMEDRLRVGINASHSSTTSSSRVTRSMRGRRCLRGFSTCSTGIRITPELKTGAASGQTFRASTPVTGAAAPWATSVRNSS